MIISILYEVALYLLALVTLPKMLYQKLSGKKYQNSFSARFGVGFPNISKGNRKLVWLHAVSMGETKALAALAKMIKADLDNPIIIVSFITETGHAEAKRSMPFADHHVYLPFDFYWMIAPIVRRASPDLVILCETDFWLNFLKSCKKNGAVTAVVNGKLSERSMRRFQIWKRFTDALFGQIDKFCVQNALYAERFKQIGVPATKITVTGNLKFDEEYPKKSVEELASWEEQLGIKPGDSVLVVGSTHDPEESLVLDVLEKVWQEFPQLKALIVPRHPERFPIVAELIERRKIPFIRYSQLSAKQGNEKVVLVDTMGLLRTCYQLADLAIVAGSYTARVGGHNVIEPCGYGVPVLFGPHTHTQIELVNLVLDYAAGKQVPPERLADELLTCLRDPTLRKRLGDGGKKLVSDMQGSTRKSWAAIRPLVES